jgi:ATP-dependent helicase/nuclease subunit B
MPDRTNVYTIPPGVAFLDNLVDALLEGRLIRDFDPASDPLALSAITIYLPTRRSVRAIRESFLRRLGPAVLLPKIRPVGDIDEDGLAFGMSDPFADPQALDDAAIPPPVDGAERQLFLTQLILRWSNIMARQRAGLPVEAQLVPSSPADAVKLSGLLCELLDAVATGEADWSALDQIVGADLAHYWEITLEFLRIATEQWPAHLAERGLSDPGERRDRLIRMEAERLARAGSADPVIAAGSTGSIAATSDLLSAIAGLPNGAVVLPGLDMDLDEAAWTAIRAGFADPVMAGHPQFGLARLITRLGVKREDVRPLVSAEPARAARNRLVSEAIRPADSTHVWSSPDQPDATARTGALDGVGLIEAANEREEALAIAVVLRHSLLDPDHVAALVTPDRKLARRVAAELERWDIRIDDSAGTPLSGTRLGILARLACETAIGGGRAEKLLALIKHPLVALGSEPADIRRAGRALERAVLRGPRLGSGFATLRSALAANHRLSVENNTEDQTGRRLTQAARGLTPEDWAAADDLAGRLDAALEPLAGLAEEDREIPLGELFEAHWACLQALCRRSDGGGALTDDEASEDLLRRFGELSASAGYGPQIEAANYPAFFEAILGNMPVRPRGADPRIHIWGALEARLQHVDTIVLGGLNDGVWPLQTSLDPFLSRGMRETLDLEPPERRIGLAAHDFTQAMGQDRVWLTRAERQDGEPRVASRWLQRLSAYAGAEAKAAMAQRGGEMLALARTLDMADRSGNESRRPCPAPALALRPKRLSVTAIEMLIRDPYAVYARHILRLRPFEPIAAQPGPSDRGSLFHDALDRFVAEHSTGPFDAQAERRLVEIGREIFDLYLEFPDVQALWWPRFRAIAAWFVCHEASRDSDVVQRMTEVTGAIDASADLQLTVRADRIDRLGDGRLAIIDYKTGAPPGVDEVLSVAPQLLLEALIAEAGGFDGIEKAEVAELAYYHLRGSGEGGKQDLRGFRRAVKDKPAVSLDEAKERTGQRLKALAAYYADPANGYLSRKIPRKQSDWQGDYDHLARVAEWSIEADE